MITIKIDIVGGGISGLSTAISIKKRNKSIKVVVHEKYKIIGYNNEGRRCGEAHSVTDEWAKWIPKGKSIFKRQYFGKERISKRIFLKTGTGIAGEYPRQTLI